MDDVRLAEIRKRHEWRDENNILNAHIHQEFEDLLAEIERLREENGRLILEARARTEDAADANAKYVSTIGDNLRYRKALEEIRIKVRSCPGWKFTTPLDDIDREIGRALRGEEG